MKFESNLHFQPGELKRIIILGAGAQLLIVSDFCALHNLKLQIYTGERHRDIRLPSGNRLFEELEKRGRPVCFCDHLDSVNQGPFETADNETLIISFGSPFIIKQPLIDLYHGRVINSHGAPLPEFRGGGGLTWRFLAGDTRGAVLFHRITTIIDDGAVLYRRDFEFPWPVQSVKDWLEVDEKEQELGLKDFLSRLIAGEEFSEAHQDESKITYFPRLNTDTHAFIDFSWPGEMIARFIGAFSDPYSGASAFISEDRVRIFSSEFVPNDSLQHPFLYGLVTRIHIGICWIICKDGVLKVPEQSLHPLGKVKLGDRLYTPAEFLDSAFKTRIVYTPKGVK
jgi:methionyl-tRNA formyltransferase